MLLNSKDRPKVDGVPVPLVESSTGTCRQLGIISTRQISSISCTATAKDGRKYELQFESDGAPVMLRRIRQSSLEEEKARARKAERLECRRKAAVAKVLPRDWTAYVIRCLRMTSRRQRSAHDIGCPGCLVPLSIYSYCIQTVRSALPLSERSSTQQLRRDQG